METYVVRIWRPAHVSADPGGVAELHGIVEHIATGHSDPFRGPEALIALLVAGLRGPSRLRDTLDETATTAEGGNP
jgi:hypothetical protein